MLKKDITRAVFCGGRACNPRSEVVVLQIQFLEKITDFYAVDIKAYFFSFLFGIFYFYKSMKGSNLDSIRLIQAEV